MHNPLRRRTQVNTKIPLQHPAVPWTARHAGWLRDRYEADRTDREAPYARQNGRMTAQRLVPSRETVQWKEPGRQRYKLNGSWGSGICSGRVNERDEPLLGMRTGVIKARTVRRLAESYRNNLLLFLSVKGTPWTTKAATTVAPTPNPRVSPPVGRSVSYDDDHVKQADKKRKVQKKQEDPHLWMWQMLSALMLQMTVTKPQ